jgi:hypothetical protein
LVHDHDSNLKIELHKREAHPQHRNKIRPVKVRFIHPIKSKSWHKPGIPPVAQTFCPDAFGIPLGEIENKQIMDFEPPGLSVTDLVTGSLQEN